MGSGARSGFVHQLIIVATDLVSLVLEMYALLATVYGLTDREGPLVRSSECALALSEAPS